MGSALNTDGLYFLGARRRNVLHIKAPDRQIDAIVTTWLKSASDRGGRRKTRLLKALAKKGPGQKTAVYDCDELSE